MKISFFEVKDYELPYIEKYAKEYGMDYECTDELLGLENAGKIVRTDAVSTLGFSRSDAEIMRILAKKGTKYFLTRTVGYEHIDVAAARANGIKAFCARYDSSNVADFAVMLMLMLVRKCKISVVRALVNNFSLDEMMGRDLRNMTVGVVGTGKIGSLVVKNLSGFGCRIICCDKRENPAVKDLATYVTFDELIETSDIITLHLPLLSENYHMIDEKVISRVKKGTILINTARGQLVDTAALIKGIETERLGGAGLDTIEGEEGICHVDIKTRISSKQNIFYLKQFPNVIYTPHIGFYTQEAVAQMVESTFAALALATASSAAQNPYLIED